MRGAILLVSIGLLGYAGCRSDRVDPSGSYPDLKTGNQNDGELVVDRGATGLPARKGAVTPLYTVYDEHGREIKESATAGTMLPAGRYLVRLEDPAREERTFWVTIEPGKTTWVDVPKGQIRPAKVE